MKKIAIFNLLSVVLFLNGCVSVPMAPSEADARAKKFVVTPGMANIYVFRNESRGGAIAVEIHLNNQLAGKTGPDTYFLFTVDPGEHQIKSVAENTSTYTVNARAGENHFIWQKILWGASTFKTELVEVSNEEGRLGVDECKLIASEL